MFHSRKSKLNRRSRLSIEALDSRIVPAVVMTTADLDGDGAADDIRIVGDGQSTKIAVADNGHGISPAEIDRIFDPFFTTKPLGKGLGLGLSISYGIVREHQGTVDVQSAPGHGTTFVLTFRSGQPGDLV